MRKASAPEQDAGGVSKYEWRGAEKKQKGASTLAVSEFETRSDTTKEKETLFRKKETSSTI